MIFDRFEEKPLWTLSDINFQLKQPEEYLKGHLKRMCEYHTQGPNRSHYELKDEYSNKKRKLNDPEEETN